ncbi:MAG TPA: ABC transporter permease [Flavobacterium sp.]|jgi:putative ABC transport system permease protein
MVLNWTKIFLYHLKQNKLFSFLNILGLSIGIGGLIFAILYWNEEHSYNAWNPQKDQVYQVINDLGDNNMWPTNIAPLETYLKSSMPEVSEYCYLNGWYFDEIISYNGKKEYVEKILDSQSGFFSFFPFEFTSGSAASAIKDEGSIALAETTALRLFGTTKALGKKVQHSGRTLVVRGIYKITGKSSYAPEAVTNLIGPRLAENNTQWGNFSFGLLLKIKDPNDVAKVKKRIEDLYYEHKIRKDAAEEGLSPEAFIEKNGSMRILLEPLSTARLHSVAEGYPEGRGNYQFLLIMGGLSLLILILSIVNYVNLSTANAIKRAKEVGVRKILGASKGNIVRQFLFETVIITCFAILLAMVIVELSLPVYNQFLNKELLIHGGQFYQQLLIIFAVVMLAAGIFPAVYVTNFESLKVLKGNFGRSKHGIWLRNGMLILQFAIASFFIVGSWIVYEQVNYMSTKDLGFKGEQVLQITYRNPYDYKQPDYKQKLFSRYEMLKQEVGKIDGVESISAGAFSFSNGASSSSGFTYKGGANIQAQNMAVDFGLLEMMKIKIKQGRGLSPQFASDTTDAVLINETTAKMMNEANPIGKRIDWNDHKFTIVGVVADFHINGPQQKIPPMTFFHVKTVDWMLQNVNQIYVRVNPKNLESVIPQIEGFWTSKIDTEYPFKYDFVDKNFARTYEEYVKQKNLFALLNFIVIMIALFGLFALASYSIQRRMKEIAIRKTLGAETGSLLGELSKQYIVFCALGFAIALVPTGYTFGKWLENFAYRIDISAMPFIVGFIALSMLTLLIVTAKALQATRLDVLKYLKYE